jgi:hypothetical protein
MCQKVYEKKGKDNIESFKVTERTRKMRLE